MVRVPVEMLKSLAAEARQTRSEYEAEMQILSLRIAAVRHEEEALEAAIERRQVEESATTVSFDGTTAVVTEIPASEWGHLSRTEAVLKAIDEYQSKTGGSASPGDIEAVLSKHGRNDSRDQIGGVTAYLRRTKRIHSLGRGRWAVGPAKTSGDSAGTESPEDPGSSPSRERRADDAQAGGGNDHVPGRHHGDGGNPPSLGE